VIFGGIGSGKSSGSGRDLALTYLKNGYSGIILTGKVDEKETWVKYAKEAGREDDLVIFEPGGKYKFNPLQYELDRDQNEGGGYVDNIVALFMSIAKMGNRATGGGEGGSKEPFWELAQERCLKSDMNLLNLANKGKRIVEDRDSSEFKITIANIAKVLRDTPVGNGHYNRFFNLSNSQSFDNHKALQDWADKSYTIYAMSWANAYINKLGTALHSEFEIVEAQHKSESEDYHEALNSYQENKEFYESEKRIFEVISTYFLSELTTLAEKTKSSILEHTFAFADPFRSGLLADYFSTTTSDEIMPERTFEGKIIILNFPVKQYLQLGIYAQSIYKKIWQQAVERREVNETTRPVFMWVDESQCFVNNDDMLFQTTARSSKACTVLLTQNISNYYAVMGGANSKAFVDSLLGNLGTKIFHNNNDPVMNDWASEVISKDYRGNLTSGDSGISVSDEYQYQFLPMHFTLLKTGGKTNDGIVEAVVTVAGKKWSNDKNFLKVIFKQNLK